MLSKLWFSQFPKWARPDHPIMRNIGGYNQHVSSRRRLLSIGFAIAFLIAVVGGGFYVNSNEDILLRDVLYTPLVALQVIAVVVALTLTSNSVSTEEQRGTWDTLKLTLVGVPLSLRARWIVVFHQLRWLLLVILLGRIAYVGLLLTDLTEFQGRALDLYISGITPEVSLDAAILLMVSFMTAFIMQPVIAVAVGAAFGTIISVIVRSRALVFIMMLLVIGIYLALVFLGISLGDENILSQTETFTPTELATDEGWTALMLMTLQGDMGIRLTQLDVQGQLWAQLENGIYYGAIYLAVIVITGMLANFIVVIAAYRAAKPDRV